MVPRSKFAKNNTWKVGYKCFMEYENNDSTMENWENDIYFDENYGIVNEQLELGKSVHYVLNSSNGIIISTFIKRRIPLNGSDDEWYDIRTPYGYGGPLVVKCYDKEELISDFEKDFSDFCRRNRIVTEFVRFHPLACNALDFNGLYSVSLDRYTVGTDLQIASNPLEIEFSKKCRKNIRRAFNKGLKYTVTEKPDSIEDFKNVYYETLDRNNADFFYYFDDEYFARLIKCFHEKILVIYVYYNDMIISAGLYFVSCNTVHIHLSGTRNEYLYTNAPYVLRYAAAEWAIQHKIKYLHHGGGRSNSPDDSLYLFKKQFGLNTEFEFYIGEKIWNKDIYEIVCQEKKPDERVNDFIRRRFLCGKRLL